MLGKIRQISHMVWYCVLTYQASHQTATAPRELSPFSKAAPVLQKLLRAKATKPEASEAMAPPPVPPERAEVVLKEKEGWDEQPPPARDESPQVPKAKWGPSVPENPPTPKPPGVAETTHAGAAVPGMAPRTGGGKAEVTGRTEVTPAIVVRRLKAQAPRPKPRELSARPGSGRPASAATPIVSQKPKYQSTAPFHSAWASAKPELASLRPRATFYDEPPVRQTGQPIGIYSLSGVRLARTVVEGEATLLMAIPSAVADLVTQKVAVEMVAGRCR
eukprot:3100606-Amphidinium_carterae.1